MYKFQKLAIGLLGLVFSQHSLIAAPYSGPLIDAHNQFGCDISPKEIIEVLQSSSVTHTLLSVRQPCDKSDRTSLRELIDVRNAMPDKVSILIPTKLGGNRGMSPGGAKLVRDLIDRHSEKSVGFAEIILQHPDHDNKNHKAAGTFVELKSEEARRLTAFVIQSKKPIVLHVELKGFPDSADQHLKDLVNFAAEVYPQKVMLMHMGQMTSDDAAMLLGKSPNIHFMMSTADPFNQTSVQRRKESGEKGQIGWINLFEDQGVKYSSKSLGKHLSKIRWKRDWQSLIEANPDRFVFAIDLVFKDPWLNRHAAKVEFWRYALGLLPEPVALKLACQNAQKAWGLSVSCR